MAAVLGRKFSHLVAVLLAVTAVTFGMLDWLPGDTAAALLGEGATAADIAAVRAELKLDEPLPVRYLHWLGAVLSGDFGQSYRTGEDVLAVILARLPVSLELMLLTQGLALSLAVPLGVLTAYHADTAFDRIVAGTATGVLAVPTFVLAILLIFCFALKLDWLPATGYVPLTVDVWANLRAMLLPTLALGLTEAAIYLRVLRADMRRLLGEKFILAAHAKGLPLSRVLFTHALRPAALSLLTLIGLNIGNLIGGALVVESIFALPGIGRLLVDAVYARDVIMVQGVVFFIALAYVGVHFLIDACYVLLDPRIRLAA